MRTGAVAGIVSEPRGAHFMSVCDYGTLLIVVNVAVTVSPK